MPKASSKPARKRTPYVGPLLAVLVAVACYAARDVLTRPLSGWRQRAEPTARVEPTARAAEEVEQQHPECADRSEHCAAWARDGECDANGIYMNAECARSCGNCDAPGGPAPAAGGEDEDEALAERRRRWPRCTDKSADCAAWARDGECEANARFMKYRCSLSCDTCEQQDFHTRCRRPPNATAAMPPGQMDAMFARAATSDAFARYGPRVLSTQPWVLVFDEFLSADEADAIVSLAERDGGSHFAASQGTGELDEDGSLKVVQSSYRTSATNWCEEQCINETVVAAVRARVEALTGVPDANHEFPQILRYGVPNYYKLHHDFIPAHAAMPCGPRILTMFLYLTDVEEGGHTAFPDLNLSVTPRKGRALLWPSVLSDDPETADERTYHRAEPVLRGVKYSVNLWLHQHDFKAANAIACTG